jgi:hypothetical protein
MRTEYLIYFRESAAYCDGVYIGVMPQYYFLATDFDRQHAIDAGGKDVSDNDGHWREWVRQQNEEYMHA